MLEIFLYFVVISAILVVVQMVIRPLSDTVGNSGQPTPRVELVPLPDKEPSQEPTGPGSFTLDSWMQRLEGPRHQVDWEITTSPVKDVASRDKSVLTAKTLASGSTMLFAPSLPAGTGADPRSLVQGRLLPRSKVFYLWVLGKSGKRIPVAACMRSSSICHDTVLNVQKFADRLAFQLWLDDDSAIVPSEALETLLDQVDLAYQES